MVFLTVPLKKTSEVDLTKPLTNALTQLCASYDDESKLDPAAPGALSTLRRNSTWRTLDRHESSLETLYTYYDQLTNLEAKCPATELQIPFKWKDAFEKGSFFGGSTSIILANISFERTCILFNIGAMQSQIAAGFATDTGNDENIKSAVKYFQLSSGVFQKLRNTVGSMPDALTPDLHGETLEALHVLMLAQAQECVFYKCSKSGMKEGSIAKVCAQCADLYGQAAKAMQKETPAALWDRDWIPLVTFKQHAFSSLEEYYQSIVAKNEKEAGEELSRLTFALEQMRIAQDKGGQNFSFGEEFKRIQQAHASAKKDNDFIYHARIPDIKEVPRVSKAVLAKPMFPEGKLNPKAKDLFESLIPVPITQALMSFNVRKQELVSMELAKLKNATTTINNTLSEFNLPAALEDVSGNNLPQSILDKAQEVRQNGGLTGLEEKLANLPSLHQRNKEILDETERMLNDEEESDKHLRQQFGAKWTRVASDKLNEPFRTALKKYRDIISRATSADALVGEKFAKHRPYIQMLSMTADQLTGAVPASADTSSAMHSPSAQRLHKLLDQLDAIKNEREVLKSELKNPSVDVKSKFFAAMTSEGNANEDDLSLSVLKEVFDPLCKQVEESIERQGPILKEVHEANAEFAAAQGGASKRDTMLRDLAAAYDSFMEINENLSEGTKFYNQLSDVLLSYQTKVGDYCFARKTEKEEYVKDMQRNIVNSAAATVTPRPPAHVETAPPAPAATTSSFSQPATVPSSYTTPPYPVGQPQAPYQGYGQYTPFPYIPMPSMPASFMMMPPQQPYGMPVSAYPPYPSAAYPGQPTAQPPLRPTYPYPQQ